MSQHSTHLFRSFTVLCLTLIFISFGMLGTVEAKEKIKDDPLSLAALMIKDKHFFRAQGILEKIDLAKAKEKDDDFNETRYHTLSGITYLKIQQYKKAIPHFEILIKGEQTKPVFYKYLAQAYYQNGDFQKAIDQVNTAIDEGVENAALIFMKVDAYQKLGKPYRAWDALNQGEEFYPYDERFPKQKIFSLIEYGFYQKAADLGLNYVESFKPDPRDYIAIGTALGKAGKFDLAGQFLEQVKLLYPNDIKANKALANYYAQKRQYLNAARLMEPVAMVENPLMTEAAELNKMAKHYTRALFLNARSVDQDDKLKQRLSIYLELGQFEQAAAMERDLKRSGILTDDNVKYALAYAQFKAGDFDNTERLLQQIKNPRIFKKANAIRSAMSGCQENKWRCM
ncbi:lipopolysaccharide assembly protein LapB [Thiomicrospira sp. WB1]|uniref:tetratricopeptide repeat protein n=1 Tax=Thiomicrospira sp. WB1 TaxID=1685380 RepID=UPI00074890C0|nr:CDC27 family protein [Thiomicrospira sp. WB1]KUJ72440.1 hypothetical protein AVO41_01085 [Thiomicrospira sp. WB1]